MSHTRWLVSFGAGLVLAIGLACAVQPQADSRLLSRTEPTFQDPAPLPEPKTEPPREEVEPPTPKIDGAVIRAWRQATVAAEVQGVIEKRYGKEGDSVTSGHVVFEISPDLFETMVERSKERVASQAVVREQSERELKLKEELITYDATTVQEIVKAKSAAKVASHKEKEARLDLELAIRDMKKCKVRAPFTGRLVSFQRDAYESVQRFDQLFLIADTSKVYAVVNLPQALSQHAVRGAKAFFLSPSGVAFPGKVDKVDAMIDPASQTRKVYILIDNPQAKLEMGMLGQLTFAPAPR